VISIAWHVRARRRRAANAVYQGFCACHDNDLPVPSLRSMYVQVVNSAVRQCAVRYPAAIVQFTVVTAIFRTRPEICWRHTGLPCRKSRTPRMCWKSPRYAAFAH